MALCCCCDLALAHFDSTPPAAAAAKHSFGVCSGLQAVGRNRIWQMARLTALVRKWCVVGSSGLAHLNFVHCSISSDGIDVMMMMIGSRCVCVILYDYVQAAIDGEHRVPAETATAAVAEQLSKVAT